MLNFEGEPVPVGCVKDFKSLFNLQNVFYCEGFNEIKIIYLGSFLVMMEFDSFQSCDKFHTHESINSWFSSLSPWTPHFEVQDRIVWIDVEGIPLRAWSKTTFNKIARKWGELIFMDDSNSANKYSLRICVKTTFCHLIAESLKAIIKGTVYVVESEEGEILPESVQNDAFIDNIAESEPINGDSHKNQFGQHILKPSNHPSGDPFGLEDLIRKSAKKSNKVAHEMNDSNPKFPSGFTPQHSDHYEYEKAEALLRLVVDQAVFSVYGINCCSIKRELMLLNIVLCRRGYSFTWSDKHTSKMSKLDRFLVSQGMLDLFPNLTGLILHHHLSDHRPILLKETHVNYGPTPFRLYHSWFLEDDFHSVIEDSWNNDGISASNSMILLKNNLNFLKQRLKEWSSIKRINKDHDRKVIQDSLIEIDLRLDKGNGLPDDLTKRANLFRDLKDIDNKDSIDLAQKAKIKWAIEGDENSKFLHGIVNKKEDILPLKVF
nr:RNA-directed DNA polymerase, eukaryota [Tanacetum cinerariifolium]